MRRIYLDEGVEMKKLFSVLIFLFVTTLSFSQENEKIIDYLRENNSTWSNHEEYNGLVYIDKELLDDNFFFIIGKNTFRKSNRYYLGFVTNGIDYYYDNDFSIEQTKHKGKYQWQDG